MKISIITATYNSLQHLPDVISCIRQQTYPNIEYIVIDGGSIDGTVEYLKQSNLVSQIISEPDKGIYDALNKGIKWQPVRLSVSCTLMMCWLHHKHWKILPVLS